MADFVDREKIQTVKDEGLMKPVPLGRAERPSDIAGTALFFATDKADYITGEIVYVDGGWQLF